ncbi:hypothetical protein LINGRAHAP2_LOCUS4775 [Linum grandiflorum]
MRIASKMGFPIHVDRATEEGASLSTPVCVLNST